MRSVIFAILIAASMLCNAKEQNKEYRAECINGVVAAKLIDSKGPAKVLVLRIKGVTVIACTSGDKIVLDTVENMRETSNEGLIFSAITTITKNDSHNTYIIVGTYQEKAFARKHPPGQST